MENIYQITVEGCLDPGWSEWLSGMTVIAINEPDIQTQTTISGEITDQAHLRGILTKLWDMNLVLISVELIPVEKNPEAI